MVDKISNNPLEELYTDSNNHVDPKMLLEILRPFIRINRESKKVIFTTNGIKLTSNNKILVFLLTKKAMWLLKDQLSELVVPKEIKDEFNKNIPFGTIDVNLKRLSDKGLIKNDQGKYFVPDFNLPEIEKMLKKKEDAN